MTTSPLPDWQHGYASPVAGSSGVLRSADYALQRLAAIGVRVPASCRLLEARAAVQRFHEGDDEGDQDLLAEATRTIWEFYIIARACGGIGQADQQLQDSFSHALGGPLDLRSETDRNARARNAQFEMYVGAWFTAGGVEIRQAEPDWIIEIGEQKYGVAAKRVRSRLKIADRAREAAQQLQPHRQGFVFLNLDAHLSELEFEPEPRTAGAAFSAALPELDEAYSLLRPMEQVRGLITLGTIVRWQRHVEQEPAPLMSIQNFVSVRFLPNCVQEAETLRSFWNDLSALQSDRFGRV